MANVKSYLDKSDKYVTAYLSLKDNLPVDVINHITKIDIGKDIVKSKVIFDKGIYDLVVTLKPKTMLDTYAMDLVNNLIIVFLEDVYYKADTVTQYRRAKLITPDDFDYIITGFTQENKNLVSKMSKSGYKAIEYFETYEKRKNEKISRSVRANVFTDPPKIEIVLRPLVDDYNYNYNYNFSFNKLVPIYLAGALDVLIKNIIMTARQYSNDKTVTINTIVTAIRGDLNLRHLFIKIFPLYFEEI
jgi:hypothetical protein